MSVTNIAAYRFVTIDDCAALKDQYAALTARLELRGTILLAPEGINLFLAGSDAAIQAFLVELRADPRFSAIEVKFSYSETQPFGKMLVKIKPEIITMKRPLIKPEAGRAPAVDAATLKRWLDQGHDDDGKAIVMLDTRNRFEFEHGAFEGAIEYGLEKFSEFPDSVLAHAAQLENKRVVTYCTGGIRCEKAAIFMQQHGIENVTQLEGGILKYFEEVGGAHYRGGCFVFDERIEVDPQLQPVAKAVRKDLAA